MEMLLTALTALQEAWVLILEPTALAYLSVGVVLGLSIGVFPGRSEEHTSELPVTL